MNIATRTFSKSASDRFLLASATHFSESVCKEESDRRLQHDTNASQDKHRVSRRVFSHGKHALSNPPLIRPAHNWMFEQEDVPLKHIKCARTQKKKCPLVLPY